MTGRNKELAVLPGAHQGYIMYRKIPKMQNNNCSQNKKACEISIGTNQESGRQRRM